MKKYHINLWGMGLALLFLTSCFIDDSDDPGPPPDIGNASIYGQVKHHDDIIPNANVYIKINSVDFPGDNTSIYSDSTKADKAGFYTFENLYQANYYIYAVGYDTSFQETVKGGVPVIINSPGKEMVINIPVAE